MGTTARRCWSGAVLVVVKKGVLWLWFGGRARRGEGTVWADGVVWKGVPFGKCGIVCLVMLRIGVNLIDGNWNVVVDEVV